MLKKKEQLLEKGVAECAEERMITNFRGRDDSPAVTAAKLAKAKAAHHGKSRAA